MSEHIHESVLGQGSCELCETRERRLSEALAFVRAVWANAGQESYWRKEAEAVLASQTEEKE